MSAGALHAAVYIPTGGRTGTGPYPALYRRLALRARRRRLRDRRAELKVRLEVRFEVRLEVRLEVRFEVRFEVRLPLIALQRDVFLLRYWPGEHFERHPLPEMYVVPLPHEIVMSTLRVGGSRTGRGGEREGVKG